MARQIIAAMLCMYLATISLVQGGSAEQAEAIDRRSVDPPPFLHADSITAHEGDARNKARWSLDQILEHTEKMLRQRDAEPENEPQVQQEPAQQPNGTFGIRVIPPNAQQHSENAEQNQNDERPKSAEDHRMDQLVRLLADDPNLSNEQRAFRRSKAAQIAMKLYARSRQDWRAQRRGAALRSLNTAKRFTPDHAKLYTTSGRILLELQRVEQARKELQRAIELEPDNFTAHGSLGRIALQNEDWQRALWHLGMTLEQPESERDPVLRLISQWQLASTLLQLRYDAAAIEIMQPLLKADPSVARGSRYARLFVNLYRNRDRYQLALGDARMRLGEPELAQEHYNAISDAVFQQLPLVHLRKLYVATLMNQPEAAMHHANRLISQARRIVFASRISHYMIEHFENHQSWRDKLRSVSSIDQPDHLQSEARLAALLMAMPLDKARQTFDAYRTENTLNFELLGQYLKRIQYQASELDEMQTEALLKQMVDLAQQDRLVRDMVTHNLARFESSLKTSWARQLAKQEQSVAIYLAGRVLLSDHHYEKAREQFLRVIDAESTSSSLREESLHNAIHCDLLLEDAAGARQRIAQWAEAGQISSSQDGLLRSMVDLSENEPAKALRKLETMVNSDPKQAEVLYRRGTVLWSQNNREISKYAFEQAVEQDPTHIEAYRALLVAYEQTHADLDDYQKILALASAHMPTHWMTQILQGEVLARSGRGSAAASLLEQSLYRHNGELLALRALVRIYGSENEWSRAAYLLENRILTTSDSHELLPMLAELARRIGDMERYYAVAERYWKQQSASVRKYMALLNLYEQWDKPVRTQDLFEELRQLPLADYAFDDVIRLCEALLRIDASDVTRTLIRRTVDEIELEPQQKAEILYLEALIIYQQHGIEHPDYPKKLEAALKASAKHPAANNDLGYFWADKGIHLQRALKMTKIAVDAEPRNAAYLDSLGWVYYKLGEFDQAERWLGMAVGYSNARDPEILDHLGDTFYRKGQKQAAVALWQRIEQLTQMYQQFNDDTSLKAIAERAKQKVQAEEAGEPVSVAELGKGVKIAPSDEIPAGSQ